MKQHEAFKKALHTDISESEDDKKHLQQEETIMDLPDVEDIPGQEHIHPPALKAYNDVTVSSDDEEGKILLVLMMKRR